MSEGKESQEIFVGVHKRLQSFVTQRLEFKAKREYTRPGMLVTIRVADEDFSLLFLHLKSGCGLGDFGVRTDAYQQMFKLKRALDRMADEQSNFIIAGDLNTMGADDPAPRSTEFDRTGGEEVAWVEAWAGRTHMRALSKTAEATWWNGHEGTVPAELDHVFVSELMDIRGLNGRGQVTLLGWTSLKAEQRAAWLSDYSDHAMLWFEVWAGC